ncbi:MAG TPA: hypothetical protein ENI49_06495 [Thermoplasmatales archaeon]|nr:hypothetical protein [Thermoplasmatales archaeon]
MTEEHKFRYDTLYRVIDETEEMRIVEGNFKDLFDRLKRINNLGIIPEFFEMAKYPKYEHHSGTIHQVNSLLEVVNEEIIPQKYRKPLQMASLFLHTGHLPFTYSTERALLLAGNLGDRSQDNKIKQYLKSRINKVLDKCDFDDERKQTIFSDMFSLRDYKLLYRYFSGEILVSKWGNLKSKISGLNDEDLKIVLKDLIDTENDGYRYLELADKADFVQRDALYFGTVRIDISPKHLYHGLSRYKPSFSISEERLIETNLDYLAERFYDDPDIVWFSKLYEKILASLLISKRFELDWLKDYDDAQFKRLISEGLSKDNTKVGLPPSWTGRAKKLLNKEIKFSKIFDLDNLFFQKGKDIIDIEYELIGRTESERGLLTYPFDNGILIDINYPRKNVFPPFDPEYRQISITLFQDNSNKKFIEVLKVVKNLTKYLSISHVKIIRESLGRELSWTKEVRIDPFDKHHIVNAIAKAVLSIENEGRKKLKFIKGFLNDVSRISTFGELWHNFENQFLWKENILHFIKEQQEDLKDLRVCQIFGHGLISLPTRLLQYKTTKKYLDEIYEKLKENISSADSKDDKGHFFEALCLIDKIRTKRGEFQFFINGMTVVDPQESKDKQDQNEFDIIELRINDAGKAECWIYACSIADDYRSENREQLTKLADHLYKVFPELIIRTRYLIPTDKSNGEWNPREEDGGRNYN